MAANSILKLKVDNTEYDANIKKAAEGIQHLAKRMHDAQGDFEGLDKASLDFIKNVQYMTTSAKTASGQYRELENAYKNLAATYEGLNAFEKEGDAGKALAEQLEILKKRTLDMKANMDAASKSLQDNSKQGKESSSILDTLASKFTINIDALKLMDYGLQAVNGALNIAKDAFMSSEANVDEWGRTVAASESVYQGFLNAINTGDISGYLSRIDEIVSAARTAYNELDRLGTMKTIQAPAMSAQQTENERMRMMIQTGRYIAPIDGRKASMQNGQLLTPDQIRRIEQQLQNGMHKVVSLVGNEVKQTSKAIDAVYNRQAKELGLSLSEFRKGTSSMAEFDKRIAGYDQYQQWRASHTTIDLQSGRETVARGNPYEQFAKWGTFRVDGQRYNDLIRLIQQRDQQASQAYNTQSQAYRAINRAEGITVKGIMKGESGGGGRTPAVSKEDLQREKMFAQLRKAEAQASKIIADERAKEHRTETRGTSGFNEQNIANWTSMMKDQLSKADFGSVMYNQIVENMKDMSVITELTKEAVKRGLNPNELGLTDLFEQAFDNIDVDDSVLQGILDKINTWFKDKPIELNVKTGEKGGKGAKNVTDDVKALTKTARITADVVGTIGQAFNAIEDPAAKVAGTVAQAIANVALAYSDALAKTQAEKFNIWGFIAAASASTISMASTIAAIHSQTGYAEGGIVKGNHYSGDMLNGGSFGINAGELVLNRAQQGSLASQLEGSAGGFRNGQIVGRIEGEKIVLVANRYFRRTGQGEIVTWK